MIISPKEVHETYAEFQKMIDEVLGKSDPDLCIPWSRGDFPAWADEFRPRSLLDFGSARGHFTASIVSRLKDWGCIESMRHLHLVEAEPEFGGALGVDAKDLVVSRCATNDMRQFAIPVEMRLSNTAVEVVQDTIASSPQIMIGAQPAEAADLIVLSHFTYYFSDGGRALLTALSNLLRHSGGVAWLVVRSRNCPIYMERERLLAAQRHDEELSETYAEDIEAWLAERPAEVQIVDARDQAYLTGPDYSSSELSTASLLMWRRPYSLLTDEEKSALHRSLKKGGPLFQERHFILMANSPPISSARCRA